jgi:hypothetical protein
VAGLRARTWKDAFPLADVLRGVLLYLLSQISKGQQLAVEYARWAKCSELVGEGQQLVGQGNQLASVGTLV